MGPIGGLVVGEIRIPYNYEPREYQVPFLRAMDEGCRRACLVWHRRAGKDKTVLNFVVKEALRRVGNYYYFFPTYNQGRKVLWDGRDKDGFSFLSHIPKEVMGGDVNNTEMKIPLMNGSLIQVVGSDNIDTVVGTNPVGCVFSEYSLSDPRGWDFVRPILRENGGWAVFVYTPRGKNHGHDLYMMAKGNEEWFCEVLTVRDTYGRGGTVSSGDVEAERRAGMKENLIEQEFYCSFEAAVENAVFGDQLYEMRREGRIGRVPYQAGVLVDTYWDLGWDDATTIWFVQTVRGEVRCIDYYEGRGVSLDHYVKVVKERPYVYGRHVMPHDAGYKDMKTGKSVQEIGWEMGFGVEIGEKLRKEDQINAARMMMNRVWMDEVKCGKGIDALASYQFGYDDEKKVLSRAPIHNWASHAADSFMLMAVGLRESKREGKIKYPSLGLV